MSLLILVVDDILESRRALCALVADLGHVALGADSGPAALQLLEQHKPDLVLLDLLMPGMDGFAVTREMREIIAGRWVPVIVTSSFQGDEHFIYALENGADDYLVRPVSPGLLQAKLRHYSGVLALQFRHATLLQRQRDILDNILDPVITLDAHGRLMELNQTAAAMSNSAGQPLVIGMSCLSAFGVQLEELLDLRQLTAHRGVGISFIAALGMSQWHEDGLPHYTLVLRDLTEQLQVDRMKDEFLATVSHELRTPLTSVLGALGLLAGGAAGPLPTAAAPLAEVARRNGERLSHLIDDILDLTKLEGDRLVLHQRQQPVVALLQEALVANQGYADRAGVHLLVDGLDCSPPPQVYLDGERFLQVMANLLSNAIKHSPSGQTVRVSLTCAQGQVMVTVRDRGPGIDPRFRKRMFEKFSQSDGSDRRSQGGTGLGLYITRMLVERMGGQIAAEDVADTGAAFSVRFAAAGLGHQANPARPVLLHVDSDYENRNRVARWLAPLVEVESLAELSQAREWTRQQRPALCLGNPQDQGSADAFCHALRQAMPEQPVILLSDSVDDAFCAQVQLPWLSLKSTGQAELLQAVQQALLHKPGRGKT